MSETDRLHAEYSGQIIELWDKLQEAHETIRRLLSRIRLADIEANERVARVKRGYVSKRGNWVIPKSGLTARVVAKSIVDAIRG